MSFSKLKEDHKLTQEQLSEITGYSRRKIQNLLAFAKVDKAIWDRVSNISKVSAKSAETILSLSKKSDTYKHALIEIAEEIRKGAGSRRIEQLINAVTLGQENQETSNDLIQSSSGQVFASWNNGKLCFSKNINLNKKTFNEYLVKFFVKNRS
jgi:ParB family chromosome partitioning protein